MVENGETVMITNLKPLLEDAKQGGYALGAFNVYNYETIKGTIEAINETKMPAIIAFGQKYLENMTLKEVVNLVRTISLRTDVPLAIHLDHTKDIDIIKKAIEAGFTSVMYDGSALSFEDNIKNTKAVVAFAHPRDVSVEAELGSLELGGHSNEDEGETIYTDPDEALEFVQKTNVDALAVSIGTVHGLYKGEPKISVTRLKEIHSKLDMPLVLHGGSGTPVETIQSCIANGITKINVNTEVSYQVVKTMRNMLEDNPETHLSQLSKQAVDTVKTTVIKHMKLYREF